MVAAGGAGTFDVRFLESMSTYLCIVFWSLFCLQRDVLCQGFRLLWLDNGCCSESYFVMTVNCVHVTQEIGPLEKFSGQLSPMKQQLYW